MVQIGGEEWPQKGTKGRRNQKKSFSLYPLLCLFVANFPLSNGVHLSEQGGKENVYYCYRQTGAIGIRSLLWPVHHASARFRHIGSPARSDEVYPNAARHRFRRERQPPIRGRQVEHQGTRRPCHRHRTHFCLSLAAV